MKWWLLIGFIILCNLIGAIGGIWTSSDSDWYKNLEKPSFNPPSWVFMPVWTILFTLMGISLYFVYTSNNSELRTIALIFFVLQFILNLLWSYFFFGRQNILFAFIDIIFLEILIIITAIIFYKVNKTSGYLLIPYFLWVYFASFLNFMILKLNR